MAIDEALIEVAPGEMRIALREHSRLSEIVFVRKGFESVVGNLYLGRVERTLPGIQSAFVDIGLARSGFLGVAEIRPIGDGDDDKRKGIPDYVREGETVMVRHCSRSHSTSRFSPAGSAPSAAVRKMNPSPVWASASTAATRRLRSASLPMRRDTRTPA